MFDPNEKVPRPYGIIVGVALEDIAIEQGKATRFDTPIVAFCWNLTRSRAN